jgi:sugar transferase (PEP-CTERM/EpsH1 system associated)
MPVKNILFIVPYTPNLIRVRPYNLIRHLSKLGLQITLVTLWSDEVEKESIRSLEPYVQNVISQRLPRWRSLWNCLAALPSSRPLQSVYCWEPALARKVGELLRPAQGKVAFDLIHIEHLRGAPYGLYIKSMLADSTVSIPLVWDSVDSISLLFRQARKRSKSVLSRAVTRFELGRTEGYEGWLPAQFEHVLVTSPADRGAFLELAPKDKNSPCITVLRNGVDLDYFRPDDAIKREKATLVISGKMSYHANVTMVMHFVEHIMPSIWARRPETRLLVVGKDPRKEILSLANHPNITVTGTVKDLPPYLQRATIAVTPIAYGVGIQNKVLEAMGCATPVVTTPQAVSALEVSQGEHVLVAEEPEEFAAKVSSLLDDPQRRRQLGESGRRYVEEHHRWDRIADQLAGVYNEIAVSHSSTAGHC